MLVAILLVAMGAAIVSGGIVWVMAGFWWAVVAYAGVGAASMLLTAVALHVVASARWTERSEATLLAWAGAGSPRRLLGRPAADPTAPEG